ncbi:tyrosine-type recombinase/integrase [Lactiplantibacillus dongliensis]|uniref:Tyrosine-type recombinase/integrase n=1 Tax=Lactiplantibacillus dongliensis TaxID=2559919 RepID=A0ABW1R0P7_9LACO|nr:tyrosine-type recombinase/integrase [Lactiplantibacillus dongliensis]
MQYNVEPLRTSQDIDTFLHLAMTGTHGARNQLLILIGLNTGLRMSDILGLTVGQVKNDDLIVIIEKKTKKRRLVLLAKLRSQINNYIVDLDESDYLFTGKDTTRPLSVNAIYKVFQTIARKMHRTDIGTHTLRKTFGYHYYQETHDIATLMMIFNHSSEAVTKRYIGLNQDVILKSLANFSLGLSPD